MYVVWQENISSGFNQCLFVFYFLTDSRGSILSFLVRGEDDMVRLCIEL